MIEFLKEVKIYRLNAVKTVFCGLCLLVWSSSFTMFGPAMLTLKELFHTSLEHLAMSLSARTAGHVSGTIASGYLLMSVDHQPVIIIAMFALGISFAFINWVQTLYGFVVTMFINGLCSGFATNGINTWVLYMWGTHNPPFFQMINFGFSLGCLMGPLIVAPFLDRAVPHPPLADHNLTTYSLLSTPTTGQELDEPHPFRIAVHISSVLMLTIAVFLTAICVWKPTNSCHPSRLQEKPTESSDDCEDSVLKMGSQSIQWKRDWKLYRLMFITFVCLYIHLVHGLEMAVANLLPVFVVKCSLGLSAGTASMMLSLYWVCFIITRAVAIGVSIWLRPKHMIALDLILITIANVLILPFANDHEWAMWLGTSILGIGTATLWPSLWGFLEESFPVSSKLTSLITLSACTGEVFLPLIVSKYIETYPVVYVYSLISYNFLAIFIFSLCCLFANKLVRIKQSL